MFRPRMVGTEDERAKVFVLINKVQIGTFVTFQIVTLIFDNPNLFRQSKVKL